MTKKFYALPVRDDFFAQSGRATVYFICSLQLSFTQKEAGFRPEFHKYGLAVRAEGLYEHYWLLLMLLVKLQERYQQCYSHWHWAELVHQVADSQPEFHKCDQADHELDSVLRQGCCYFAQELLLQEFRMN